VGLTRYLVTPDCAGCGACLLTCPERAIRPYGGRLVVLDSCIGCALCAEVCPVDACVEAEPLTDEVPA
jgi:electron transport complex protein RnfB